MHRNTERRPSIRVRVKYDNKQLDCLTAEDQTFFFEQRMSLDTGDTSSPDSFVSSALTPERQTMPVVKL
jgi:hypothetical protein